MRHVASDHAAAGPAIADSVTVPSSLAGLPSPEPGWSHGKTEWHGRSSARILRDEDFAMTTDLPAAKYPPLPAPDALTQFFWDGVNDRRLLILRCQACGHYIHYPRPVCNRCLSTDLAPAQVSGRATLYSYTVTVQAFHPYFVDKVPYVLAVVELPEQAGLKLTTNIIDCPEEQLRIGMPVQVTFQEVGPGLTLPLFRPG